MIEKSLSWGLLLLSILYAFLARELSFGTFSTPKAGFLPQIAGISAVLLALAVVVRQVLQPLPEQTAPLNWRKSILVAAGIFAYIIGLKTTGYFIATCAVLIYWFKITDTAGWLAPCALAATVTVLFQWAAEQYLGIHLP